MAVSPQYGGFATHRSAVLLGVREPEQMPPGWAVLAVHRPGGLYRDALRRYEIEVDGVLVDLLRPGWTLVVGVVPGHHWVQGRIDWCSSPAFAFEASEGRPAYFTLEPNGGLLQAMGSVLGSPAAYLRLTPGWTTRSR